MGFVMIQFDPEQEMWDVLEEDWPELSQFSQVDHPFYVGAEISGLQWEHLDKLQKYQFRVLLADGQVKGLRFLGTEARWGEFVPATPDQLVLKSPG